MEEKQKSGIVLDMDYFAAHDGPGIRTAVYLKGCPLHCAWCHSPESQQYNPQILFAKNRCTYCGACMEVCSYGCQRLIEGERIVQREGCMVCGQCAEICPSGALTVAGKRMTVEDVMREVLPNQIFYQNSGGGVTISGGEVLAQAEFTLELLKELKAQGIHTIVETSGYGRKEHLLEWIPYTDLFYYDFKLAKEEDFLKYTGGDVKIVLENLKELRKHTDKIVLRVPMIPDITDTKENIEAMYQWAEELSIKEVHLLPYNTAAGAKYEWCGRDYTLEKQGNDRAWLKQCQSMAPKGIQAVIM